MRVCVCVCVCVGEGPSTLKALEVVMSLSLMKMEKKAMMSCTHCSLSTSMSTISRPSWLDIALPADTHTHNVIHYLAVP